LIARNRILLPLLIALAAGSQTSGQTASPHTKSVVPFVGCKSDGQVGPRKAPQGKPKTISAPPAVAQRLAYYEVRYGVGVLAPRGWFCFGTYGSSGTNLYVAPQPLDPKLILSAAWKGFTGPAVQSTIEYGGTSGRFGVAQTIARVFPTHTEFVSKIISDQEQISPVSFPRGPYPNDKLVYKSNDSVEFETPAHSNGLGTDSFLLPSPDPIHGVKILVGAEPDLLSLSVRLPASDTNLTSIIIQQIEKEATTLKP
jgi:hypothetical protein